MRQNAETRELPVETSGILADLDTPEDYREHSGYRNGYQCTLDQIGTLVR
jgi:hypothetical protein